MARRAASRGGYRVKTPEGGELPALGGGAPFDSVPTSPFGPEIPGGADVAGDGAPGVPPASVPGTIGNTGGAPLLYPPPPRTACAALAERDAAKRDMRIKALNIAVLPSSSDAQSAPIWLFRCQQM
jgi:hypothetical protein